MFGDATQRRRDVKTQAAFKRAQFIKNRIDTNTNACVHTLTHAQRTTHTHTACCPVPTILHVVYECSSNGQVVIRPNKETTSANLWDCSVLLCFPVCVDVCGCALVLVALWGPTPDIRPFLCGHFPLWGHFARSTQGSVCACVSMYV